MTLYFCSALMNAAPSGGSGVVALQVLVDRPGRCPALREQVRVERDRAARVVALRARHACVDAGRDERREEGGGEDGHRDGGAEGEGSWVTGAGGGRRRGTSSVEWDHRRSWTRSRKPPESPTGSCRSAYGWSRPPSPGGTTGPAVSGPSPMMRSRVVAETGGRMRAHGARRGVLSVSGLQSALARIGAIERMVSDVRVPGVAAGTTGATSFADALDQATRWTRPGPAPAAVAGAPAISRREDASGAARRRPRRHHDHALGHDGRAAGPEPRRTASVTAPAGGTSRAASAAYRPAHVTETDERVWNDCTWASATMWIDKLTGGAVKVDRETLRAASGDTDGRQLAGRRRPGRPEAPGPRPRAPPTTSASRSDDLLDRLAAGGGAIVQGSYSSLPSHLTRHDPGFAAKGAAGSGHAVYVGPLDRATGKVWWDDPLAPAGGSGEWISVKDLKRSCGRTRAGACPRWRPRQGQRRGDRQGAGDRHGGHGAAAAPPGLRHASSAAAAISAAAWTAGVDPLLLTAYLDVADEPSDAAAIAEGATRSRPRWRSTAGPTTRSRASAWPRAAPPSAPAGRRSRAEVLPRVGGPAEHARRRLTRPRSGPPRALTTTVSIVTMRFHSAMQTRGPQQRNRVPCSSASSPSVT